LRFTWRIVRLRNLLRRERNLFRRTPPLGVKVERSLDVKLNWGSRRLLISRRLLRVSKRIRLNVAQLKRVAGLEE